MKTLRVHSMCTLYNFVYVLTSVEVPCSFGSSKSVSNRPPIVGINVQRKPNGTSRRVIADELL